MRPCRRWSWFDALCFLFIHPSGQRFTFLSNTESVALILGAHLVYFLELCADIIPPRINLKKSSCLLMMCVSLGRLSEFKESQERDEGGRRTRLNF